LSPGCNTALEQCQAIAISLQQKRNLMPQFMNTRILRWASAAAGTVAALGCLPQTSGQTVDALLDKLVDKGILTQD
jgi:hypothetical protein